MKHILALLLLLPCFCFGQVVSDKPFKKANVIVVQTSDSLNVALRTFGQALVARGYTIKSLDTNFHTLLTEPKQVRGGTMPMTIVVRATPAANGFAVTAESSMDLSGLGAGAQPKTQRLVVSGEKPKGPLVEVIEAAKAYPGGWVGYRQE